MYKAFRTNTEEILKMENSIKSIDIDKLKSLQKDFKQKIRPFILPKDGIIKGETLKDTYFPTAWKRLAMSLFWKMVFTVLT